MVRVAWQAVVHRVAQNRTQQKQLSSHTPATWKSSNELVLFFPFLPTGLQPAEGRLDPPIISHYLVLHINLEIKRR